MPPASKGADGEARQRIYLTIRDHPGIHKSEIARRLGLTASTVANHVKHLERLQLVRAARVGRTVHLVVTDHQPQGDMDILLDPQARQVLALLGDGRIHSPGEIKASSGLGEKAVRRALQRLEGAGLIRSDGAYHPRYWAPAPRDAHPREPGTRRSDNGRRRTGPSLQDGSP